MGKEQLVKNTINHVQSEEIPYCIHFAEDAYSAYSKRLFHQYAPMSIRKLVEKDVLTLGEGLTLGLGNFVFALPCPWWDWYQVPASYTRDFEAPGILPNTIGTGNYQAFIEKITLVKELTGAYILVLVFGSHFEKAYFSRGIENFLADMAGEPDFSKKLLNKIINKNLVMLENIVNIPEIDGVLLGSDWGSQKSLIMSPDIWREMIAPGEKKEYDLIKSGNKDVWIHSCGNIEAIIPDLINMGVDVLNPLQPECMDIYKIKKQYGNKLCFWGGISTQQTLPYGTADEVKKEARNVAKEMSEGGGYILAPSQDIQADVPYENVCALIDIAKELCN